MVWPTTRGTDVTCVTDDVMCSTFYHCCVVGAPAPSQAIVGAEMVTVDLS